MEIIRYGVLPNGIVFKEEKCYRAEGTRAVSTGDSRLVSLPNETGLWLLCSISNKFTVDTVETDEAAYDAHILASGGPFSYE